MSCVVCARAESHTCTNPDEPKFWRVWWELGAGSWPENITAFVFSMISNVNGIWEGELYLELLLRAGCRTGEFKEIFPSAPPRGGMDLVTNRQGAI